LNRGVDKRKIFNNQKDYVRFIHNLFAFNDHKKVTNNLHAAQKSQFFGTVSQPKRRKRELLVHIHAFVLMPNHYHLLLSPLFDGALSIFLKKINMGYAKYFNEKNQRIGALFQGKTKRIIINKDPHYMHILHYIHCNPLDLNPEYKKWRVSDIQNVKNALDYLHNYRWSSFLDYIDIKNFQSVTYRNEFLLFFKEETGGYIKSTKNFLQSRTLQKESLNYLEFEKKK